jgi:hypothetical protein
MTPIVGRTNCNSTLTATLDGASSWMLQKAYSGPNTAEYREIQTHSVVYIDNYSLVNGEEGLGRCSK